MYIAPASGHALLNLNLPFKLILMRFEVCFLMSGVRMLHFLKDIMMYIHSNPQILYYGFNIAVTFLTLSFRKNSVMVSEFYFLLKVDQL